MKTKPTVKQAEDAMLRRLGTSSSFDQASWLLPSGKLAAPREDHDYSAKVVLKELGVLGTGHSYTAELRDRFGFIRMYVADQVMIEAPDQITWEQLNVIQKGVEKVDHENFTWDVYSSKSPGAPDKWGRGLPEFLDSVQIRRGMAEAAPKNYMDIGHRSQSDIIWWFTKGTLGTAYPSDEVFRSHEDASYSSDRDYAGRYEPSTGMVSISVPDAGQWRRIPKIVVRALERKFKPKEMWVFGHKAPPLEFNEYQYGGDATESVRKKNVVVVADRIMAGKSFHEAWKTPDVPYMLIGHSWKDQLWWWEQGRLHTSSAAEGNIHDEQTWDAQWKGRWDSKQDVVSITAGVDRLLGRQPPSIVLRAVRKEWPTARVLWVNTMGDNEWL
jgi:hypothetical protein